MADGISVLCRSSSVFEYFERALESGAGQETFQDMLLFLNRMYRLHSLACRLSSLKNEKACFKSSSRKYSRIRLECYERYCVL